MNPFKSIYNAAKAIRHTSQQSSPMRTSLEATRQAGPSTVSVHTMPSGGMASDVAEVRANPQLLLHPNERLARLRELSMGRDKDEPPQFRLHPIPPVELDAFNASWMIEKYLGPYPVGKNYFWQQIWGLPNQVVTKAALLGYMAEALKDGLGELTPKDWQEAMTADTELWFKVQDAGIQNSLASAYNFVAGAQAEAADRIRRGESVDSPVLVDVSGRERHSQQVHAACHALFSEISNRYAAMMTPLCQRLRQACIRLIERQAKIEEDFAVANECGFRSSNKLVAMLYYAMFDRLGSAGWLQPFHSRIHLGCALPPSPDP